MAAVMDFPGSVTRPSSLGRSNFLSGDSSCQLSSKLRPRSAAPSTSSSSPLARPSPAPTSAIFDLFKKDAADKKKADSKQKPEGVRVRYDASNMRWVKDDRFILTKEDQIVTPATGSPYVVWPVVYFSLQERGLKSVPPPEAVKLMKKGWVLLDIREAGQFAKRHAEGAVNVPLFRPVEGRAPIDNVKRFIMATAFAMEATERNPDFAKQVQAKFPRNTKFIVYCQIGGTMDTLIRTRAEKKLYADPDRSFGRESRSLKACYELFEAGYKNVQHLEGGLNAWVNQDFDMYYA